MAAHQRSDIMRSWYLASLVLRYHTWPVLQRETNGQHSHGVALIYARYFAGRDLDSDFAVVRWILEHDLAELWSGDAPFPAKVRFPMLGAAHKEVEKEANMALRVPMPQFTDHFNRQIKVCDLLQMHMFGMHEVRLGNKYAIPIMKDTLSAAVTIGAGDEYITTQINKFKKDNPDE